MHIAARVCQLPRDDEPIAAVISFADKNADAPAVRRVAADGTDDGTPGGFHQDDAGNADAFYRLAVDLAHFRRGDNLHQTAPFSSLNLSANASSCASIARDACSRRSALI